VICVVAAGELLVPMVFPSQAAASFMKTLERALDVAVPPTTTSKRVIVTVPSPS